MSAARPITTHAAERPKHPSKLDIDARIALSSAAANEWDVLTLYAVNPSGGARTVTLEWGGTAVDDRISIGVPAGAGLTPLVDGLALQNGAELRAYADQANGVILHGVVRRYEQNL